VIVKAAQAEIKAAFWSIFDNVDQAPGERAVAEATRRAGEFAGRYRKLYPRRSPAWKTTWPRSPGTCASHASTGNASGTPIERTFGESRRRVKVIGRLPGETTCLSLVWAVLDRASRGWRGGTQTSATIRQLQDLRHHLLEPPRQLRARTAKTAKTKTVTPAA
jgi:putative transposase